MTDKVGQDKKEMTVFRRNKEVKTPLVAAKGGLVWGGRNKEGQSVTALPLRHPPPRRRRLTA